MTDRTDRINGLVGSIAIKAPVKVATTENIVLQGSQTINGVVLTGSLSPRERVLVKDQTDPVENGIYDVNTSAWKRSPDFDGDRDAVDGTIVNVSGGLSYFLSAINPVSIGIDELTFTESSSGGSISDAAYGAAWDGDTTTGASKNAIYDKIEGLAGGHDPVTVDIANGLSLSDQSLSLAASTNSTPGAATAAQVTALEALVINNTGTNTGDNAANTTYANDYRAANFVSGTDYEPAKGADDNFVTDDEKIVIGNTSGTNTGDQVISDVTISLTDITTNNVSTLKHGFAPKGTGDPNSYLDSTGSYSIPSSAPQEGTVILSTGITVGKVLQADGDDTSSWVTLPGGGDALVSNPLSQFAATTSLQLKGVISDETGSGALVFAESPALVTPTGIVKGDVGLGNVDNTSDATKDAAIATLTNKTLTSPVINTPTGIVKGDVGLGNVDNTSDVNKPVSTATATAIAAKVSDSAYGVLWDANTDAASKNAIYDKIESLAGGHDPVTISATANGLYLTGATQELNLAAATNSTPGAATAAQIAALESLVAGPAGFVYLDDYANGDGTTDDVAAIAIACAVLGTPGGTIYVGNKKYLIDSAITIPKFCHIVGPHKFVGQPTDNLADDDYDEIGGTFIVNSTITISMSYSSSLFGLFIHRKGMNWSDTNATNFAGTAITIAGRDVGIQSCMILGFNKGVYSNGYPRLRLVDVLLDNQTGIEITDCLDVAKLIRCHAWPFATIAVGNVDSTYADRSGSAFYLHDTVDWAMLNNCFSYGYAVGFNLESVGAVSLNDCGADGTLAYASSIGIKLSGAWSNIKLSDCVVTAQEIGLDVTSTFPTIQTGLLSNCIFANNYAGTTGYGIKVNSGNLMISGGIIKNSAVGVYSGTVTDKITISGIAFDGLTTRPVVNAGGSPYVNLMGDNEYFNMATNINPISGSVSESVASSTSMSLPRSGSVFKITGTTGFSIIGNGWEGRRVVLHFDDVLTISHGNTSSNGIITKSGTAITTSANYSVGFTYVNSKWIEDGPSISGGSGTVTSVAPGNGMNFATITGAGTVTLGTPGTVTSASTNAVTTTSHTHAFTTPALTGEVTRTDGTTTLTIADNVVDEANMKISNAPVNNYVLTADSGVTGGWKWALAPITPSGTITANDYSKFSSSGVLVGRSYAEVRSDLNVADGATANAGTVTSVSAAFPISVATGTTTPSISIAAATGSTSGVVTSVSQTFGGVKTFGSSPLVPTATVGTNNTTAASCAFVLANSTNNAGTVTGVTGTAPIVSSGGTAPAISIPAATASVNGYATSIQITKLDGIATGATANTGTVTGVTGTAPIVSSGGTAPAISIPAATSSSSGYATGIHIADIAASKAKLISVTGNAVGGGAFYSIVNEGAKCGYSGQSWLLVHSKEFIVGSAGYNDTMDDLAILQDIRPYKIDKIIDGVATKVNALNEDGHEVIDHESLPDWLLGPKIPGKGVGPRGVSTSKLSHLTNGAVRQLDINMQMLFEHLASRITTLERERNKDKSDINMLLCKLGKLEEDMGNI